MTRDEQMQQALDRVHVRLLDLIEHPEKIEMVEMVDGRMLSLADCDLGDDGPDEDVEDDDG